MIGDRVARLKDCPGCEEAASDRELTTGSPAIGLLSRIKARATRKCPPLYRKHPFCGPRRKLNLRRRRVDGHKLVLQCAALERWANRVVPELEKRGIRYWVASTYRSPREQTRICQSIPGCGKCCAGTCACACHSGHQLGACLDSGPIHPRDNDEFRHVVSSAGFCNFSGLGGPDPWHWNLAGCF